MSVESDRFVTRVQDNRGKIKSQRHLDMLHTICLMGSDASKAQAEHKKMLGIAFIESVVVQLSEVEQEMFWEDFMDSPNQKITDARLLLLRYV